MSDQMPFGEFVENLRRGDEDAWVELCKRYEPRLHKIARSRLKLVRRSLVGSDEPVQSALRTFVRRLRDNALDLSNPDHLERLLIRVTLYKAVNSVKHHHRHRRDARREVHDPA